MKILSFEEYQELYHEDATCIDAESGADRELDYDEDETITNMYAEYLENINKRKAYIVTDLDRVHPATMFFEGTTEENKEAAEGYAKAMSGHGIIPNYDIKETEVCY